MKSTYLAPGTCGELVQGTINNINFSITCPINVFSRITVAIKSSPYLTINDPKRTKVLQAVHDTMLLLAGEKYGADIFVESQLPMAKGMASSTADITAACMATAAALNYGITYHEIAQIALNIEPTDGLFFPGIVAFDHVHGKYFRELAPSIDLDIMIFDFGGTVDTICFNQRKDLKEKNKNNENQIKFAYELVIKGLKNKDPYLVAEGATISALLNQSILKKPNLDKILDTAFSLGALGINVAHSGTIFGVLLHANKINTQELKQIMERKYPFLVYHGLYQFINGGLIEELEGGLEWHKSGYMAVT